MKSNKKNQFRKKKVTGIVSILGIMVIISLAMAAVFSLKGKSSVDDTKGQTIQSSENLEMTISLEEYIDDEDTDGDGLLNGEEKELGTSLEEEDSDFDFLSDYEEVKLYGTNPLKGDSDGDGIEDGYEINLNMNPVAKDDKETSLEVINDDLGISMEIRGLVSVASKVRVHEVENNLVKSSEYMGSLFRVNGDGDFVIDNFSMKFSSEDINDIGTEADDFQIYRVDEDTEKIEPVATTVDINQGTVRAEILPRNFYFLGRSGGNYSYYDRRNIEELKVDGKTVRAELIAKNHFDKAKDPKIKNFKYKGLEGMCHGIASISAIDSAGQPFPLRAKYRNAFVAPVFIKGEYDLKNEAKSNEENLLDAIYWWFGTQEIFSQEYFISIHTIDDIIENLEKYPAVTLRMSRLTTGHYVVAAALYKDIDSGTYYMEIHDNNDPTVREFVEIEEKHSWFGRKKIKLSYHRSPEYNSFKFFNVYKRLEDLRDEGYFDFGANEESVHGQLWDIAGDAYFDYENNVVLTEAEAWKKGAVWYKERIQGPFKAEFDYQAGGGSGADGFVFMFNKNGADLGFDGGDTAFGEGGFGIEFDSSGTKWNEWDPEYEHVAIIKDSVENHMILKEDNRVSDNLWHRAVVEVGHDYVKVTIDGDTVIDYRGQVDLDGGNIGFAAATGMATNRHVINLKSFTIKAIK